MPDTHSALQRTQPGVRQLLGLGLRGMLMGLADLLPGVSGGTMALLTGIYPRFITALAGLRPAALLVLRFRLAAAWRACDGWLLLALGCGIGCSLLLFAHPVSWLLANHQFSLMSCFAGLIGYTVWRLIRMLGRVTVLLAVLLLAGVILAFFFRELIGLVNSLAVGQGDISLPGFVLGGALAICAMMLPGISGSLLLLLLGLYQPVIDALARFELTRLVSFSGGMLAGLLLFAPLLRYSYHHYQQPTLALLAGLTLGAMRETLDMQTLTLTQPLSLAALLLWAGLGIALGKGINYVAQHFATEHPPVN